jgi:hypothetical protein
MKKEACIAHKSELPPNDWLPPLILNPGDWNDYLDILYSKYLELYQNNKNRLQFNNKPVSCRKNPKSNGKGYSFWHLTSYSPTKDTPEEGRIPVFERCERIAWSRAIIENAPKSKNILIYDNLRKAPGGKKRRTKCLLLLPEKFIVVLIIKPTYYILKTAYFLDFRKSQIKCMNEYCSFKNITINS